jgi:ABC-type transport system involved in multi-copper enzyme maturation permease subunit
MNSRLIQTPTFLKKYDLRRFQGWVELEISSIYAAPVLEGLVALLVFVSFFGVTSMVHDLAIPIGTDLLPVSVSESLQYASSFAYLQSITMSGQLMMFLLSMLIARTLARGFEEGLLTTYLSYPVSRASLLTLKVGIPVMIVGLTTTLASIVANWLFFSSAGNIYTVLLITGAFWLQIVLIATSVALIAVATKSVFTSATIGIGVWFFLLTLIPIYEWIPIALKGIISPIMLVGQYLILPSLGPTTTDLAISFVGGLLLFVILSILTYATFKRSEVVH